MNRVVSAAIIVTTTVVLYAIVDWGYGVFFPVKPYADAPERLTLSAYAGESYFSEAFLAESYTQPGGWDTLPGTRLVLPREYHGKHFNVDTRAPTGLPYRRTVNEESSTAGARLVLLLGGSTIYNSEVPDALTVASQLSRFLNRNGKGNFHVLNAGVSSVNTIQERERLALELDRGLRPDIVVSLNGINDVNQGVYFGNPENVMFSGERRNRFREFLKAILPLNIYRSVRVQAAQERSRIVPPHLMDPARVTQLARQTAVVYRRNLLAMQTIGLERGFRFYSILQPHFFSASYTHAAKDLGEIGQLTEHTLPQARSVYAEGYKALCETIDPLRADGVRAIDATALFRDKTTSIFLDIAHVNSTGNRMLAEYIGGLILADVAAPAPLSAQVKAR